MSIVVSINENDFHEAFNKYRPKQFSDEALDVLFDYYNTLDEDFELDICLIVTNWEEFTDDGKLWEEYFHLMGGKKDSFTYEQVDQLKDLLEGLTFFQELDNGHYLVLGI